MSRFGGNRGFGRGMKNARMNESYKDTLFCESRECGKIIGRGGSKIRELQDSTQTRIKVSRDDEPDGTRRVEISGTEAAVEKARQLIEDVLGFNDSYNNDHGWSDRRAQGGADRYENGDNDRYVQDRQQGNSGSGGVREEVWGEEEEDWGNERRTQGGADRYENAGNDRYVQDQQQGNSGSGGVREEVWGEEEEDWGNERRAQGDADRYENAGNDRYVQDQQQGNSGSGGVREEVWGEEDEDWGNDAQQPISPCNYEAASDGHDSHKQQQGHSGYSDNYDNDEQQWDDDAWSNKRSWNSSDRYESAGDSRYGRNHQQGNSDYRGGRNDDSNGWSNRRYERRGDDCYGRDSRQGNSGYRGGRDNDSGGWSNRRQQRGTKRDDDRYGRNKRQGNSGNSTNDDNNETDFGPREVLYISANQVGRLIGKKGANIQELQETCDCTIKVGRDEDENGDVTVTLIGFKTCIAKVKMRISKLGIYFTTDEPEQPITENCVFMKNGEIDWNLLRAASKEAEKKKFEGLVPIIKEFYKEESHVRDMHPEDVKQFRLNNNNIMVNNPNDKEKKIPNPVPTFKDCFRHYPAILEQINKQGFTTPSPIQAQAWPILMLGQDLIGIAQTGTGKTLAFLLPALIHIDGQTTPRAKRSGPSMLVLCPTRELALQIEEEVNKFSYKGIKSVCVYGGGNRREQIKAVRSGVEIVVATPGRLNDLVDNEILNLSSVTYLVLDEADRMLDMGFEPDIRKALLDVRPDRQTVMTSATWPLDVQSLATTYMNKPAHVQVGTMDLAAVHSVRQEVVFMDDEEKKYFLFDYLENIQPDEKVIVFVGKKAVVDDISSDLCMRDVVCQSIHGDREQDDRIQALDEFKRGEVRILIATDVASRGLDVKDITHVLNYDFPRNIEEYVHRIGRTGRAGRSGVSITILTRGDWRSAQKLIDIMAEADQEIPQELLDMAERYKARQERDQREGRSGGRGRGGRGRGGRGRGGRRGRDDFFC